MKNYSEVLNKKEFQQYIAMKTAEQTRKCKKYIYVSSSHEWFPLCDDSELSECCSRHNAELKKHLDERNGNNVFLGFPFRTDNLFGLCTTVKGCPRYLTEWANRKNKTIKKELTNMDRNIKIERSNEAHPLPPSVNVKITAYNDGHTDAVYSKANDIATAALTSSKRISRTNYVDTATGEIKEYKHSLTKADNIETFKESLKKLRRLILHNFAAFESFFITLTYAKDIDYYQTRKDFDCFYNKLRYHYKGYLFDYLCIVEPQGSGKWHIHLLLKSADDKQIRISSTDVQNLWNNGNTSCKQIYDVSGLAAYFGTFNRDNKESGTAKSAIKTERAGFYPSGARIYTKSKGIIYPVSETFSLEEAEKRLNGKYLESISTYKVIDEESAEVLNTTRYETYTDPKRYN